MQSRLSIENDHGNIRVVAIEFGQEEPYRIPIGFWHRFLQTVTRIVSNAKKDASL